MRYLLNFLIIFLSDDIRFIFMEALQNQPEGTRATWRDGTPFDGHCLGVASLQTMGMVTTAARTAETQPPPANAHLGSDPPALEPAQPVLEMELGPGARFDPSQPSSASAGGDRTEA
jgi:hypothetical protein